jgi:hypothetical protein
VAFEALQTTLTSSPVLGLPDFSSPFEVVVDASLLGTEAVLIPEGHPVAYSGMKYIAAGTNDPVTEQDCWGWYTHLQSGGAT